MFEQVKVLRRMETLASHTQKVLLVRFGMKNVYVYGQEDFRS